MNARSVLLALFVALTIVLASTTVYESGMRTTVTSTSTSTNTLTSTSTNTLTSTVTTTSTLTGAVTTTGSILTASGFQFITGSGICTANGALAPCLGEPAFVFNCPPAFPSEPDESCSQVVPNHVSPYPSFGLSITSYSNQSEPWANCAYQMGFASKVGAYCVLLNSSAFIMGEPAPPTTSTSSSAAASIQIPAASVSRLNPQTSLNLILNLTANANPYPTITLTAYDVNTLDNGNNITSASAWPVSSANGVCSGGLVNFAVYQGDYSTANYTQGTPLSLSQSYIVCTSFAISYYIFNPLSKEATAYYAPNLVQGLNPTPLNASISATLFGYWGTNPAYPQGALLPFLPGTYTVAAVDEWGGIVLSHLTIQG